MKISSRTLIFFFAFFALSGCAPEVNPDEVVADEYVLIEFASKLEEEFPKLEAAEKK